MGSDRPSFAAACVLAAHVVVAAPSAARADDGPVVRLRYEVSAPAEGCPSEISLRDLVLARVGRDPFDADAEAEVRATVEVAEDGAGLRGRVEIVAADGSSLGERSLPAPRGACRDLVHAMVVPIAIALDPATTPLVARPPEAPAAPPEPLVPAPAAVEGTSEATDTPGRAPRPVELSLLARARVGATPNVAVGGAVGAALRGDAWSFGLEVAYVATPEPAQLAGVSTEVSVLEGALLPCFLFAPFGACLSISGGVMEVRGQLEPDVARAPWAEAGARLRCDFVLAAEVALRVELEATVLVLVPSVHVDHAPAWAAGPITGALSIGAVALP